MKKKIKYSLLILVILIVVVFVSITSISIDVSKDLTKSFSKIELLKLITAILAPSYTILLFIYNLELQSENDRIRMKDNSFNKFKFAIDRFIEEQERLRNKND